MPDIILTEHERRLLTDVLEEYLSELRMEIADTDRMSFRDMLKEKKRQLLSILHAVNRDAVRPEAVIGAAFSKGMPDQRLV